MKAFNKASVLKQLLPDIFFMKKTLINCSGSYSRGFTYFLEKKKNIEYRVCLVMPFQITGFLQDKFFYLYEEFIFKNFYVCLSFKYPTSQIVVLIVFKFKKQGLKAKFDALCELVKIYKKVK